MTTPKIKSVLPLKEKRLLATFVNGVLKVYDCQKILKLERFQLLQHESFFKAVTVDAGGSGVLWNDERDLSEYELWNNGVEVEQGTAWSMEGAVIQQASGLAVKQRENRGS
jgi:hypothetical protein